MKALLYKEWHIAIRQIQGILQPIFFLFILITLFPIALGSESSLLTSIAPSVIWIGILLAVLLAGEKLYREDFEDGSLEQLYLSGQGHILPIYIKLFVQWVTLIAPIIIATPLFAIFYQIPYETLKVIIITILIGSPSLLLFAMLGASITLSVTRAGLLLILLILPFYIPVLILSISAIREQVAGFDYSGLLALLGAFLIFTLIIIPFAIRASHKISIASN